MTIVTSLMYERFIGIDYSGARNPLTRSGALQVYSSRIGKKVARVAPPTSARSRHRNWCGEEIAEWRIGQILQGEACFIGIDHGFSFPIAYFRRNRIRSWEEFLIPSYGSRSI